MRRKIAILGSGLGLVFGLCLFLSGGAGTGAYAQSPRSAAAQVEISPAKQQRIGVKKTEAAVLPLERIVRTVGRVEADEGRLFTVNSKVEVWVEKLLATYTGKYVKKGEVLAEVYAPELLASQLEYQNLLRWKTEKGHRFQRNIEFRWGDRYNTTAQMLTFDLESMIQVAQQKLKFWDLTDEEIQKLGEGGAPSRVFPLVSPAAGYLVQKPAVQGRRFDPGEKLFDIADLSSVWVLADVYTYELPLVRVGQSARITLAHFPGKVFQAKVDYIYPQLSGETRTAKARFVLPNPGDLLKPQMFANVEIRVDLGRRLAVPEEAILDTGTRQVVFVETGEWTFEPREVAVGYRAEGLTEILKGLKAGEKVVSSGNFLIDSEAKLRGVIPP